MATLSSLTVDELLILTVDADPIFNGADAPIGSLAMLDGLSGSTWVKTGDGMYDWTPVCQSAGRYYTAVDEFDGPVGTATGRLGWVSNVSNGAITQPAGGVGVNSTDLAVGVIQLSTGTNAAGRATLSLSSVFNQYLFGYCRYEQEWRIKIPTLASSTQNYEFTVGFIDNNGATNEHVDGVYFAYYGNGYPTWQCCISNNSTRTYIDTGVTVTTSWVTLKMVVSADGSTVYWYINNTLVGTSTTANTPKIAGRETGCGIKIMKSVGTTARTILLDRFYMRIDWSQDR